MCHPRVPEMHIAYYFFPASTGFFFSLLRVAWISPLPADDALTVMLHTSW